MDNVSSDGAPAPVRAAKSESVIMMDRAGQITDDPARAVRGEIVTTYSDDVTEHTLFTVPGRG